MVKTQINSQRDLRSRAYPVRCVECGKMEIHPAVAKEKVTRNYDGREYELTIDKLPVSKCGACGEVYYAIESDDAIVAALRRQLGLLSPDRMRANLDELRINQKEAAARLGIAPETLSRWLTGAMVQSRAMDNLLRAFFACPDLRDHLSHRSSRRKFGEKVTCA